MINGLNSACFLIRILLVSAVILPVILYFEQSIMQSLIPLLKWEITELDDSFNILFFGVSETKGASNIELNVVFNHDIVVNQASQAIASNFFGSAGLLTQNVLHPLMIITIAILAWPASAWQVYAIRLGAGLPLVILMMMLDSPFQLLASILTTFSKQIDSPWVNPSSMIYWSDFLNGGGLFALSLVCSVIAIRVGLIYGENAQYANT